MNKHDKTGANLQLSYTAEMQELYKFTEGEFLEFDKIVPMRLNKKMNAVSPKLYFLLMSICGQIESVAINICKNLDMYDKDDKFAACYKKLCNESDVMESQSVQIVTTRCIIRPFTKTKNDTPSWWTSYNKVKHEIPSGIEHATVKNTVHALGGLYLLLNIYESSLQKNPKGILDKHHWVDKNVVQPTLLNKIKRISNVPEKDPNSNLFILKKHFMESDQ